jgi:hypothetical protein
VHFGCVLLISSIMSVPWASTRSASYALAATGVAGVVYSVIVVRRARTQTYYKPVWQDWLWYATLPLLGYFALAVAGFLFVARHEAALIVIAGVSLGLLFVGVHNAWDTVTHLVVTGDGGRSD